MISNFINWWWGQPMAGGWINILYPYIFVTINIIAITLFAWNSDRFREFMDMQELPKPFILFPIFLQLALGNIILGFLIHIFPIVVILGVICLYFLIVSKWGVSYRKIVSSQEEKKLGALAQLIKDDPDVKAAYEKLMKEKSLNTDIFY